AELYGESVALAPGEDLAGHFRRLPETDRQHAGGQGVEAAHVPCLVRAEQPANPLQRRVRGQADRLVEQEDSTKLWAHASLLSLTIAFDGAVDEVRELCGPLRVGIDDELELRGVPQLQAPSHFSPQKAPGTSQADTHLFSRMSGGEGGEEHARRSHVGR